MSILPGTPRTEAGRQPAERRVCNVRPVERTSPVPPGTVHPVLADIARRQPRYTDQRIDGRPVRIYLLRDRTRWVKVTAAVLGATAVVGGLVMALVYAVGAAVEWVTANASVLFGAFVVTAAAAYLLRSVIRRGICCTGLHCPGCSHR